MLSQDEPRAWLWSLQDGSFVGPEMVAGAESILTLPDFDSVVPLADIYSGIE